MEIKYNEIGISKEILERFWSKVIFPTNLNDCWEWKGNERNKDGYKRFTYTPSKLNRIEVSVHRFIFELYYGKITNNLVVCHNCDNPGCCNPTHLFLGTVADNMKDMVNKDRSCYGQYNGNSSLTEENISEIIENIISGVYKNKHQIADDFNVDVHCIQDIFREYTWTKITSTIPNFNIAKSMLDSRKKLPDELVNQIINDLRLGLSHKQIATKYKIAKTTVSNYRQKYLGGDKDIV
jgi:uncharacterized protein (DUF433 family)